MYIKIACKKTLPLLKLELTNKPKITKKGVSLLCAVLSTFNNYSKDENNMQEILNDIKDGKKQKWDSHKRYSIYLSESYMRLGNPKAYRVKNCGNYLTFKRFEDDTMKLHKADFCKVRLCPMCAWRRSLKIFGQVSKVMNYFEEHFDYKYIFLTLTVKNVLGECLSEEMDKLFKAFNLLTKRKEFKAISNGWFRCLEVTHNWERDDYHPHFHVVIAVNSNYFTNTRIYLSQNDFVSLWKSCLNVDYDPIVDVRMVKDNKDKGGIEKVVAELAKYAVKPSSYMVRPDAGMGGKKFKDLCNEISDKAVSIMDLALHNRRLIAFGGKFKEVHKMLSLDDIEDGNLINTDNDDDIRDDLSYVIVTYNWSIGIGNYLLC